jgi:hypothetical protein
MNAMIETCAGLPPASDTPGRHDVYETGKTVYAAHQFAERRRLVQSVANRG